MFITCSRKNKQNLKALKRVPQGALAFRFYLHLKRKEFKLIKFSVLLRKLSVFSVTSHRTSDISGKRLLRIFAPGILWQMQYDEITNCDIKINLRSQFVTLNKGRGAHRKYLPYAFIEHIRKF